MLAEIESALITRVKTALNGSEVIVAGFPGESEQEARASRQARVFVGYRRSTFQSVSAEPMTFEMLAEFEVVLLVRNIRTYLDAYPLLDAVRAALTGFWADCDRASGKCYPTAEAFNKVEEGIWYYSQTFAVPLLLAEDLKALYPPPYIPVEVVSGLHRSKVGNLADSVLDRELQINLTANP